MILYTKDGAAPVALPATDVDPEGNTWTNLQENPEGRAACGWTEAPSEPAYDPALHVLLWDDGGWTPRAKSPEELEGDLETARASAIARALAMRLQHENGGAVTPYGIVATDESAQRLIGGASTAVLASAMFNKPFSPIDWTMADGTVVTLSAEAVVIIGLIVVAHVNACRKAGTAALQALQAATSVQEVQAVNLTEGYP